MPGANQLKPLFLAVLFGTAPFAVAEDKAVQQPLIVEHHDKVEIDKQLTLSKLVDLTTDKYPDRLINEGLREQADALKTRGDGWFAGSYTLQLDYANDQPGDNQGFREASAQLQATTWFWGQRAAAQAVAEGANHAAEKQVAVTRLEVSRLVREALWTIALAETAFDHARYTLGVSEQLLKKVERQVELGDLARADLLLAQSEHLQIRSQVTQAEAELMHARKAYMSLTQQNHIPANYRESLTNIREVPATHPLLEVVNALIERKQAGVSWAENTDTINQPKLTLGAKSTRDTRGGIDNESVGVGVVIPFGHGTYDAPEIAAANLELAQTKAQREHLYRLLEKSLHEAQHALEVTEKELAIANELKGIAEQHLNMSEISFAAGEINLLDLLKIQSRTMEAIRYAKEQEVKLQRDIAFYNQAVGVMP
jgi:outer membrane protein TolC